MEYTAVFEERVSLTPRDIRARVKNIDTILEGKIRSRLEGKCSRHGYVLNDSTKILSRSMGSLERGRFSGHLIFHVQVEGKVLNPPDKTVLDGKVIRKNKMGLYVNYRDAIRIIIPRDANIGNEEFESVEVGQTVTVEIKKSRFQVNDEYILSVGLFVSKSGEAAPVKEEVEEEEEAAPVKEEVEEEEEDAPEEEEAPEEEDAPEEEEEEVPEELTTLPSTVNAGKKRFEIRKK